MCPRPACGHVVPTTCRSECFRAADACFRRLSELRIMIKKQYANQARLRRHRRVRNKLSGTQARPRLAVFRSTTHMYAQVIDDTLGRTLVAASSNDPEFAKSFAKD